MEFAYNYFSSVEKFGKTGLHISKYLNFRVECKKTLETPCFIPYQYHNA